MILAGIGVCALAATVGADARWLAALGRFISAEHGIPIGVPYAAAPTQHWPNAIPLAELVFHWLEAGFGDRGLMVANLLAVAVALTLLALGARKAGASRSAVASALLVAIFGALPSLALIRDQLFSLALFPALLLLLRSESTSPTRKIWLVVPLIAIWSNLHGAVLVGLGVTIIYLAVDRMRQDPATAIGVGSVAVLALCVTPAGVRTIAYYHGVLTNVAAQRGDQQWGALSLTSPLDVMLIVAAVLLSVSALHAKRTRPAPWEIAVLAALIAASAAASRSGLWLLLFLVAPAARAIRPKRTWPLLHIPITAVSLVAVGFAIARGPLPSGASPGLIARAVKLADGGPVVADDVVAEQVALAGGRIWVANPIDAFSHQDQSTYLNWVQGDDSGRAALRDDVSVVLVDRGSAAQALMARTPAFVGVQSDRRVQLYLRVGRQTATICGAAIAGKQPGMCRDNLHRTLFRGAL